MDFSYEERIPQIIADRHITPKIKSGQGNTVYFPEGVCSKELLVKLSKNAGDDCKIKGTSRNDTPGIETVFSTPLTVWRRLWVECDAMAYYPGTTNTGIIITPPNPENYLGGFVTSELARACVVPKVYAPNTHQPGFTGHNRMLINETQNICKARNNATNTDWEVDPNNTTSGRDIEGNSIEFWTIRVVMASYHHSQNSYGMFFGNSLNTILIYQESIKKYLNLEKPNYTDSDFDIVTSRVILHEIGHSLIDFDEHNGVASVRNGKVSTLEMLNPYYQKFLISDVQEIQKYSRTN